MYRECDGVKQVYPIKTDALWIKMKKIVKTEKMFDPSKT